MENPIKSTMTRRSPINILLHCWPQLNQNRREQVFFGVMRAIKGVFAIDRLHFL
jgi:hypothetical protein